MGCCELKHEYSRWRDATVICGTLVIGIYALIASRAQIETELRSFTSSEKMPWCTEEDSKCTTAISFKSAVYLGGEAQFSRAAEHICTRVSTF